MDGLVVVKPNFGWQAACSLVFNRSWRVRLVWRDQRPVVFSMAGLTCTSYQESLGLPERAPISSLKKMGVSQASGLNTAGQTVVNALVGAAVFGEWQGAH